MTQTVSWCVWSLIYGRKFIFVTNARPPSISIPSSITPKVMGLPNANVFLYVQNITSPSAKCPITPAYIHLEAYLHRSVFSHCTKDMLLTCFSYLEVFCWTTRMKFRSAQRSGWFIPIKHKKQFRRVDLMKMNVPLAYSHAHRSVARNRSAQAVTLLTCVQKLTCSNFDWDSLHHRWGFPWFSSIPASKWVVESKLFPRWYLTLRITGFVDFVHRPEF
jgi:hypothetical protein